MLVKGGENCVGEWLLFVTKGLPFLKMVKAGAEHGMKLPDATICIVDGKGSVDERVKEGSRILQVMQPTLCWPATEIPWHCMAHWPQS